MKKILFSLIALLCSMSINAQVMKVMKGEEVVATFTSAQANQVVFGESTGEFSVTVKMGSIVGLTGNESYETNYPSTTVLGVSCSKKDKNVASVISYVETTEKLKEIIDVETASAEDLKAFVIANGYQWVQEGISNVNNGGNILTYINSTPNTEYTAIIYATSEETDEYITIAKASTAKEALATTGTAKRTGEIDVNWVQLWEDGPKFAEYNVGAENNKAEDYGGYYCWGSSKNKDSNEAYKSGSDALTGTDDTATNLWGSAWRMPTQAELEALPANCDVEWTAVNGVNGRKFTGKGDYASNSVFLPAAGYYSGSVDERGDYGIYWSSTPIGSDFAYSLNFSSGGQSVGGGFRAYGFSVRAVLVEE